MDYDENDFQNQNHHLAGEGNNKFPPVLNPYALPKFDFDDSLQGHVRFDSLVESEVFLGIGSSEDNRWIEDFSRGSCGIDFSKSAAVPCSISRCDNVWSEATSSESVEMLLKSVGVGQEETITRRDTVEVPDAFYDLGCSTKKMEPNDSHDATLPKLGGIGDLQPSFSPEDSSRLKNDVETNQIHEVSLQSDHVESIENNASNLDLYTGEKLGSLAEGYLCDGEACTDVSGRDVSDLVTDSVNNGAEEDITCSEVKVDRALMDRDSIIVDDNKSLEGPDPTNDASLKDENGSQQSNILLGGELLALENKNEVNNENSDGEKQRNMDGDEINKQKSNINAVESMNSHLDGAAFLGSNEESIKEEDTEKTIVNETDQAFTYQDFPIKDASIIDQSNETVHVEPPVIFETDKEIDGHPVEVVSSEQVDDSCLQRDHADEKCKPVDDQLVSGDLEGNTVASSYTVDDNAGKGDADRGMTCHSADMQMGTVAADAMGSSKIEVSAEDSNVQDQVLSSAQAGTTETEEVNRQDDASNPDSASVLEGDSTMLLPGSSNNDSAIGRPIITEKGFMVPSVSQSGNNKDVIDEHEVVRKLAEVVLPSTRLDIENDAEVEPTRGDFVTQLSDSHVAVKEGSLSETVEAASHVSNEQSSDTNIPERIGNPQSLYESQTAEARVSHECNNTTEVAENLVDVTSKGDCCAGDTITAGKPGVPTPHEKSEVEPSGDASKALESSLVSKGPLPENQHISDVPEVEKVERDHRDSYKTGSDTRIANGNGNLFVSAEVKGKSGNFPVEEVGVSGAEVQDDKDGPHVPGPNEIDASKTDKSSSLQIAETSPSTFGPLQTGSRSQHSVKRGNPQVDDKENRSSKGTADRKPRRPSVKSAGRESAKKGNLVKDARAVKQAELPGKSSSVSLGPSRIYQLVQPNQILHHGEMEGLGTKPFCALTAPLSSLPDLNSSAFPPMVFQQPFNDLQQVQLRAQILVYGSLISRLVPEELHMVSAFGGPDGGRSMWEKAWQTCKARVSGPIPQPVNSETPTSSQSVDLASDPTSKQTKVIPPPTGYSSTIGTPAFSTNPVIPVSSPLWNLPTPSLDVLQSSSLPRGAVMDYQPVFPQLAQHQNQPVINCAGHSTTWMSQTPFRGPWAASPQTPALSTSIHFPSFLTEPVQLTPVKESSLALSSGMKHAPLSSSQSGVHPSATAGASPSLDLAKVIVQSGQPSADPKPKKRKKGLPSEDQSRITLDSQSHCEKFSIPAATSSLKTSATATTPACFLSKCITPEFNVVTSPAPSITPVKEADLGKEKPILAIGEVKEVRQQAEAAAALAAAAVSHSQEVWNELDKKKISGSISVSEAKIASAAVAIAAAAAIAKAAAMAANLASNAAFQAKAMADEALTAGDCSNPNMGEINSRGDGGMHSSSSIILAAKEAARRRVEAASAAALRAENLDLIVKAAEISAEAILQAGEIVTMGDPLSLGKLAEAGPEGFWKLPQFSSDQASKVHDANIEQANNDDLVAGSIGSKKCSEGPLDNEVTHLNQHVPPSASMEILRNPMEDKVSLIVGISGTVSPGDKVQMWQKLPTTSDTAPEITESQHGLRSQNVGYREESNKTAGAKRENVIQEGSRAEVFKDGAWFSADVMSLEDGKAHVSYNELPSSKGSGKLQEWVEIEGVGDKAPAIRIPHPMTAVQFDGSKKRRRAAIGSFTCSVGDRVDAWIRDRWWEGVVTDKSKKDETSMTVQLPALGETSVVKAWHLRPSLIWNGREWIEWSSREYDQSHHKGDTPDRKRAKLGSSRKQAKGKDRAAKTVEAPDSGKPEGSKLLDLSAKERVFNIGKSNTEEGKPDSNRAIRSGLRKQGLGVIFGVPKPGKKRKFMEVSKHYVVGQSNDKAPVNDSVKLANYLMPRGTGPRGLRNAPRTDAKEDEAAELKAKAPATLKSRGLSGRTASQIYSSKISVSAPGDASVADHIGKMKNSSGHVGKHNLEGAGSFSSSEVAIGGPISFSSGAPSDATVSKISAPKSDSVNKKKPAPTGEKLAKMEEDKIINSNSQVEPRRSNRRIQPTSRLLEGLQSSSITLKVPSSLHDKGHRSAHGGAKGNNHG